MDRTTRHVLARRLSNTMDSRDSRYRVEAPNDAPGKYGKPEIFNTDRGSPFTSLKSGRILRDAEIAISMDGRGRRTDNIFIGCGARSSTKRSICTN